MVTATRSADRSRQIEVVTTGERFAELAAAWDRLERDEPTPFASHAWFTAWWAAFGAGGELRIVALWEGDELAGVLPLQRRGRGLGAMANVHTPVFRPPAVDAAALEQLLDAALRLGGRLTLESLPEQDPATAALQRRAAADGGRVLLAPAHVSPIVDTTGEYADWRALSRPRWGAPLERFRRKMQREHAAEIATIVEPVDVAAELRAGFAVEASGWKGEAGTAILSDPATLRFYEDVASAAQERDELRFSRVVLDGRVAAFDLTVLRKGRLYLLKTGFDEQYRKLAPGLVMRLSIIERCFELGLEAHELLGDDSEWKRKFATGERRHATLDVYGRRPAPLAQYAWRSTLRPRLARVKRRWRRASDDPARAPARP